MVEDCFSRECTRVKTNLKSTTETRRIAKSAKIAKIAEIEIRAFLTLWYSCLRLSFGLVLNFGPYPILAILAILRVSVPPWWTCFLILLKDYEPPIHHHA